MRVHPLLHSTRRGPTLYFRDADTGAAAGGAAAAAAAPPDPNAEAAAPVDYKALLLALLSLPDDATDEQISAKETEIRGTLGGVGDLETKASTADQLQAQLDEINKKYQELSDQQSALYKQKQEADADEILKVYEGCFTDDASRAAVRNILLNDKEAGIAILNGLKKPDATPPVVDATTTTTSKTPPPKPRHDPAAAAAQTTAKQTEEEKASKISARARELVQKNKKLSLTKAYQQAEAELYPPQ
jgi:hypothetical protein